MISYDFFYELPKISVTKRCTHDARVGVLGPVAEGGGQGGGAGLVVVSVLAGVDGRVDGDGPHGGGVAVAVAVVVLAAVTRGPHVDVAKAVAALDR